MLFTKVCIEAFGYELPENIVTSIEIEERLAPLYHRLQLPYGRLEMMTGIRERRFWNEGFLPSDASTRAAEKAIARSGIDKNEIGVLIHASVCRDFLEPATATIVHNSLGLPQDCVVFDLSNACLGIINGMIIIASMIELGQVRAGLVVGAESSKKLVDTTINELLANPEITRAQFKTYFASLTIGSGAVAVVLREKSASKSGHRLLGGVVRANTSQNKLCRGSTDTGYSSTLGMNMQTDSMKLLQEGCALARETWELTRKELKWSNDDVDRIFCHQVGSAHRKALYNSLELDISRDFSTLEYLGNVGSVSLPITMAIGIDRNQVKPGDMIAMLGIGSGLNCIMLGVEW